MTKNEAYLNVDWSKQHCGVHQAPPEAVFDLMPDLIPLMQSFPNVLSNFTWDIKVHMLMPRQYPCIPDWHVDNVPRVNGIQQFDQIQPDLPMYIWVSGAPLTQFRGGYLKAKTWQKFNQQTEHRGTAASEFGWRGFIRATHIGIQKPKPDDWLRRHSQVYIDSTNYQW